jgi:uncharacterized protein YyaL (SSP411 family)
MKQISNKIQTVPVGKLITAGLRVMHPSLATMMMLDKFGRLSRAGSSKEHLDATMRWLCLAHDKGGGAGVAAGYALLHGWRPPYPETTGYIIPTFYDYAELTGQEEFRERARRMADWEIEVQLPSGAVQGSIYLGKDKPQPPVVFNTGQVILGWCRAFTETHNANYIEAAERAGSWLIELQADDGSWPLSGVETETLVHAYDVRVAWSLLEIYQLTREQRYADAARANLDWTLRQQQENGWFKNNSFFNSGHWDLPLTHTIAYVMEGFQESWRITGDERYFRAFYKTAEQLRRIFEAKHFMPGEFDNSWKTKADYSCLTGDAQIAGVWLRLYLVNGDQRLLDAAIRLNNYVKATQRVDAGHPAIRGGVKGSQPLFGRYTPYTYVNWGAKFLADSLMLEQRATASF